MRETQNAMCLIVHVSAFVTYKRALRNKISQNLKKNMRDSSQGSGSPTESPRKPKKPKKTKKPKKPILRDSVGDPDPWEESLRIVFFGFFGFFGLFVFFGFCGDLFCVLYLFARFFVFF